MSQDIRKRFEPFNFGHFIMGAFAIHRTSCNMLMLTAVDSNRVSTFQSLMLYLISYFESVMHCSQNSGNAGKKDKCRSPNNLKKFTTYKVESWRQLHKFIFLVTVSNVLLSHSDYGAGTPNERQRISFKCKKRLSSTTNRII